MPGQRVRWELLDTNQTTKVRLPLGAPEQPLGQVPSDPAPASAGTCEEKGLGGKQRADSGFIWAALS